MIKRRSKSGRKIEARQSLGVAAVLTIIASVVMTMGRDALTWPSWVALVLGLIYSVTLFRWGSRRRYLVGLLGLGIFAVTLALVSQAETWGPAGFTWLAGCVIGSLVGDAWRRLADRPRARPHSISAETPSPTLAEALSHELLSSKGSQWHTTVGAVTFEVDGRAPDLLVCHRGRPAGRLMEWEVLARQEPVDGYVDVVMGGPVGHLPRRLICDRATALAASRTLADPRAAAPEGWVWVPGDEAEGTRPRP